MPWKCNTRQVLDTVKELNSGALDFSFQDPQMASIQALQQGRLRLLAVCSGTRMEMAPTLPTMAELGYPQFNLIGWVCGDRTGRHAGADRQSDQQLVRARY